MKIIVDAMGGDNAPMSNVKGGLDAVRDFGVEVTLVGRGEDILKCLEELKAGNTEFRKAKEQTYAALLQNPLPALRCFMEEFLPGFELTLDELS